MTKGEAKALKTETVIIPMNLQENLHSGLTNDGANKIIVEENTVRIDIKTRFARLKKSLRKRSVSIL
jgi:hypothetical protein